MKVRMIIALLLCAVSQCVANQVVNATVSGWNGCTGTLTVQIDTPFNPTSIVFNYSSGIGYTCPGQSDPYAKGCYMAQDATSITIPIAYTKASQPLMLPFTVSREYTNVGIPLTVIAMPNCALPPPPPSGGYCPGPCRTNMPSSNDWAGQPINLANGNTYIQRTDVRRLPGVGPGLELARAWNSLWPTSVAGNTPGMFGPNWRSTYEERVYTGSNGVMVYSAADGSFIYFAHYGPYWYAMAPADVYIRLMPGSSNWTLVFPNGETRLFNNSTGVLTSIIDRNGNATQLSYDTLGRLSTVTSSASQHLYFTYPTNSSMLVSSVTSDFGIALSYSYDSQGRLLQVVHPDGLTENYEYNDPNGSWLITAVKDTQGKIIESHTYDSQGRGITSSRANGVEAVSVSYGN